MRYKNLDQQYSSKDILKNARNKPPIGTVFRGQVIDNADPSNTGRVKVDIPALYSSNLGDDIPWALPCFTVASYQSGSFMVPEIGSYVWVLFENNDIFKPVWIGAMYSTDSPMTTYTGSATAHAHTNYVPSIAPNPNNYVVLSTPKHQSISVNDEEGTVSISNATGNSVELTPDETIIGHTDGGSFTATEQFVFMQSAKNPSQMVRIGDGETLVALSESEFLKLKEEGVLLRYSDKNGRLYLSSKDTMLAYSDFVGISMNASQVTIHDHDSRITVKSGGISIETKGNVYVKGATIILDGNVNITGDLDVGGSSGGGESDSTELPSFEVIDAMPVIHIEDDSDPVIRGDNSSSSGKSENITLIPESGTPIISIKDGSDPVIRNK